MSSPILPFTEANSKRVTSLFRQALRTAYDHSMRWDVYRDATINIRRQFEANKHISSQQELEAVINKTKAKLAEWKHPDHIFHHVDQAVLNTKEISLSPENHLYQVIGRIGEIALIMMIIYRIIY